MAGRSENHARAQDTRLKRLAASIDSLAEKDEELLSHARDTARLRCTAALELYGICAGFVESVNHLTSQSTLILDPPEFSESSFLNDAPNLIQINVRGRILQVEF